MELLRFVKLNRMTLRRKDSIIRNPTCKTLNTVGFSIALPGGNEYRPMQFISGNLLVLPHLYKTGHVKIHS